MPYHYYVWFWIPAYVVIGMTAYVLDLKWGVPVRRFLVNLASKEPRDVGQGFIAGRRRKVQFAWALVISFALSLVMVLTGSVLWYFETALAIVEAAVCFVGMQLGPLAAWGFRAVGVSLDALDRLEDRIKAEGPALIDQAASKARAIGSSVVEAVTPDPGPPEEDQGRARIERMDGLLGKKPRDREGGP